MTTTTTTVPVPVHRFQPMSDGIGYRAECTCGWVSEPDPSIDAAFEAGCDHPHEAVAPPDEMDAAMSAMLDLQDDLARVVTWRAENWSADLPALYMHGIERYDLDDDCHRAGVQLLMPCDDAGQLARAAERLGVAVHTDAEPNREGYRYAGAVRRFGRVEVDVFLGVKGAS